MKLSEIKKMLISSFSNEADPAEISSKLEKEGVIFDFSENFEERVLGKIYSTRSAITGEVDFIRSLNFAFYRIALTGVAAIVVMLISIFLMEGSLSFNSFLGLSNNYDESIVSLLTGN